MAIERQLNIIDVPAVGTCALHAIVHQLSLQSIVVDLKSLRHQAVFYLCTRTRLLHQNFHCAMSTEMSIHISRGSHNTANGFTK